MILEPCDKIFFNERISLISEEENLKIYEKIALNDFINDFDKEITQDFLYCSFLQILHKHTQLFFFGKDGDIFLCEDNFKNYVDIKIIEFFAFLIHYNKSVEDNEQEKFDEEEKALNLLINNIESNLNNVSFTSTTSAIKKSLLKPYNKEDILYQEICETDYGNKKTTRKDLKNREEHIKKVISIANKEFFEKIEGEIVHGTYNDKQSKVVFCIPNDRDSIINKFN